MSTHTNNVAAASPSGTDAASGALPPLEMAQLVRVLLRRSNARGVGWLEWMPVALSALTLPDGWLEAFNRLGSEERFALVDALAHPHSGALADALLLVLCEHADRISDEQVRQHVLQEAEPGFERQEERLRAARLQAEALGILSDGTRRRLGGEFDVAEEILRLEREIAQMRGGEFDVDEPFSRLYALEGEIARLEARRGALQGYDFEARRSHAEALRLDLERSRRERSELDAAITQRNSELVPLRDGVAQLRGQADGLAAEASRLEAERRDLEGACGRAEQGLAASRAAVEAARQRQAQAEEEARRLQQEAAEAERRRDEIEAVCRRERGRLEELRGAAQLAGQAEIVERIAEIYRMLPSDSAEEGFARARR